MLMSPSADRNLSGASRAGVDSSAALEGVDANAVLGTYQEVGAAIAANDVVTALAADRAWW
jgi:hypothetical protein